MGIVLKLWKIIITKNISFIIKVYHKLLVIFLNTLLNKNLFKLMKSNKFIFIIIIN